MDETLAPTFRQTTRRARTLIATALASVLFASTMVAGGPIGPRAADLQLGSAPVPLPAQTETIPLDELGDWAVADLNAYWTTSFANAGLEYYPTAIVYFQIGVQSGCGMASAEIGPFYCPSDFLIYMPAEFFVGDVRTQDFAVAAVIAHEVGHHVQNLLGISAAEDQGAITSVQLELQADCLAGVWTADLEFRGMLDVGDVDEAAILFASIGDDALGVPEGEGDHGSSQERVDWFTYGYLVADGSYCVTY